MKKINAVIFDWAGTTVDYGSFAPVKGFIDGFGSIGHDITIEMARKPMGLLKIDHTRAIAKMLDAPISEKEILSAYAAFEASLFTEIEKHCDVKDYVIDTVAALHKRGVKIGSTTGYTSAMMDKVIPAAARHGYAPDFCITPDKAGKGRPYPYMIWENMKHFEMTDPREVVKVGDTVADIEEGKNANCWTVGVIMGSSEFGLNREEVAALSVQELEREKKRVRSAYYRSGADYIIDDMDELISVVDDINRKLSQNGPFKLMTPGPLTTKSSVKNAMLTDHCTWDEEYKEITRGVMRDINGICSNDDYAAVLLQGSGTYAVEAMINCLIESGEKILFLVNGEYGRRMLSIAQKSAKTYETLFFLETEPLDVYSLERKLHKDGEIKAVAFVHCETTTG